MKPKSVSVNELADWMRTLSDGCSSAFGDACLEAKQFCNVLAASSDCLMEGAEMLERMKEREKKFLDLLREVRSNLSQLQKDIAGDVGELLDPEV